MFSSAPKLVEALMLESYKNLFSAKEKRPWASEVFSMIQAAYESQGGFKGGGFGSAEQMIEQITFWKLAVVSGKVVACKLYKDKDGRKSVAAATDGSKIGRQKLVEMVIQDLLAGRAYSEVSGKALSFYARLMDLEKIAVPVDKVKAKLSGEEIIPAPEDDIEVQRWPGLKQFFYRRKLGAGGWHTKIMLGNVNAESIQA